MRRPKSELTETETAMIRLIASGYTDEQIARIRGRAPSTIRSQTLTISRRLHARTRAHAVTIWLIREMARLNPEATIVMLPPAPTPPVDELLALGRDPA